MSGTTIERTNHSHDSKEHHEEKDHDTAHAEALPQGGDRLGGPDALPRGLVEELRTRNGNHQGDSCLESLSRPVAREGKLTARDLVLTGCRSRNGEDNDQDTDHESLKLVRDDRSRQARNRRVEDSKDSQTNSDRESKLVGEVTRQGRKDGPNGRELGDQVDEHVEHAHCSNRDLHETSVALTSKVCGREGLVTASPDHGTQEANEQGWKGRCARVAQNADPTEGWVGTHLGGTVQDPGAHARGKEAQGNRPSRRRVTGAEKVVSREAKAFVISLGAKHANGVERLREELAEDSSRGDRDGREEDQDRKEDGIRRSGRDVKGHDDEPSCSNYERSQRCQAITDVWTRGLTYARSSMDFVAADEELDPKFQNNSNVSSDIWN